MTDLLLVCLLIAAALAGLVRIYRKRPDRTCGHSCSCGASTEERK